MLQQQLGWRMGQLYTTLHRVKSTYQMYTVLTCSRSNQARSPTTSTMAARVHCTMLAAVWPPAALGWGEGDGTGPTSGEGLV
jgi:hypothetical protein